MASVVSHMLSNEKMKGDALIQKSYTTDFLDKRQRKNRGEVPQYYVSGGHEYCPYINTFDPLRKPVNWAFLAIVPLHTPLENETELPESA